MSDIIFLCLENNCTENWCKHNMRANAYVNSKRQYGYLKHTKYCPLFRQEKEGEHEKACILDDCSANYNSGSNNRYSLREEESRDTREDDAYRHFRGDCENCNCD